MSKAKRKGTAFETDVVNWFCEHGYTCERRTLQGIHDKGDIAGLSTSAGDVVIECKNHKQYQIAEWMAETKRETENASADIGAAVVKRPRIGIEHFGQQLVLLDLQTFTKILDRLQ